MGFTGARSTRAKKQVKQVEYDARELTERIRICTRLLMGVWTCFWKGVGDGSEWLRVGGC